MRISISVILSAYLSGECIKLIRRPVKVFKDLSLFEVLLRKICLSSRLKLSTHLTILWQSAQNTYSFLNNWSLHRNFFLGQFSCLDLTVTTDTMKGVPSILEDKVDITCLYEM